MTAKSENALLVEIHDWRQTYTPVKLALQLMMREHPVLSAEIAEIIEMLDRRVARQRRKSTPRPLKGA